MPTEDKLWLPPLSPRDQKRLDSLRKNRKKPIRLLIIAVSIVAFVGVIVLLWAWYAFYWRWWLLYLLLPVGILLGIWLLFLLIFVIVRSYGTGFMGKTLWDWLQLLGILAIPLVVAGATLYFTQQQAQISYTGSLEQQQETTLENYLDRMSSLLLNNHLSQSKPGDEVQSVAQALTLTALHQLDGNRKGLLLGFLYHAQLINGKNATISLVYADLSKAELIATQPVQSQKNTSTGYLYENFYNLSGINLSGADLIEANFSGANLSGADLSGADLREVYMNSVKLNNANLTKASFEEGDLGDADLRGANLNYTILDNANLCGANFSGTDLSRATLSGADLTVANLKDATGITTQTLENEAKSLKGATMPNGSVYPFVNEPMFPCP
jgi:uncharacterized protein YjbI with pentapeptide repeats